MIHRILVPLDKSDYTKTAVKYVCDVASSMQAEVSGMVALDVSEIDSSVGPIAPGGVKLAELLEEKKLAEAEEHINSLLTNLADECAKAGVKHVEEEFQGSPSARIIEESKFYDLVVMGLRAFYHYEPKSESGDSLDKILGHTITPILAVPKEYRKMQSVLIVCDGELPSVRAMQRFAHIAENRELKVYLLMENKKKEYADYYLNNAEKYLNSYGITDVVKNATDKNLLDVIEKEYFDKVDLIVTGLHSHKSIKEFLLGSVAHSLIMNGQKALFLAQ